jgi:hypothetical protein
MLFRERGFAFADDAVAFNYVVDVVTFDWNFCELIYLILRALLLPSTELLRRVPKVFPIFRGVCYIFVSHSTSEGVIHKGRVLSSFITKHFSEEINVASDFGNFSTVFDKLIGVR